MSYRFGPSNVGYRKAGEASWPCSARTLLVSGLVALSLAACSGSDDDLSIIELTTEFSAPYSGAPGGGFQTDVFFYDNRYAYYAEMAESASDGAAEVPAYSSSLNYVAVVSTAGSRGIGLVPEFVERSGSTDALRMTLYRSGCPYTAEVPEPKVVVYSWSRAGRVPIVNQDLVDSECDL